MFSKTKNNPNAIPDDSKPGKKGKNNIPIKMKILKLWLLVFNAKLKNISV
jgi:hypothetical protein